MLKAEKCDWICWEGLWCLPTAQAQAAHNRPEVWVAQLWGQGLPLTPRAGLGTLLGNPSEPCAQGPSLHRPPQVGEAGLAPGHAPGWWWARHPLLCVLQVWETAGCLEPAPCPLLEGPAEVPLCLSQGPLVLDGLGAVTSSRAGQGMASSRKVCLWMPDDG